MASPFREQTRLLIPLIGMKRSRSQVSPKKADPWSQRIPIKRWKDVDFTVPMRSALPGGRIRDCALKPPVVIRRRPPGKALLIGTAKSTSFHLLMGMRCDQRPAFFGLTCERERFMPIRGMSRRVCSRNGEAIKPYLKPYADPVESRR